MLHCTIRLWHLRIQNSTYKHVNVSLIHSHIYHSQLRIYYLYNTSTCVTAYSKHPSPRPHWWTTMWLAPHCTRQSRCALYSLSLSSLFFLLLLVLLWCSFSTWCPAEAGGRRGTSLTPFPSLFGEMEWWHPPSPSPHPCSSSPSSS